jgi:hypothetical protein
MLQARCLCTTDFLPCFNEKKSYAIDGTLLGNLGRHSSKDIEDRVYLVFPALSSINPSSIYSWYKSTFYFTLRIQIVSSSSLFQILRKNCILFTFTLTPNTPPLIPTPCTYSKLNWDKICDLTSHLLNVRTSQFFLSMCKGVDFYYWICHFVIKTSFLWSKKYFLKKASRMEGFHKKNFETNFHRHF